MIRAIARIIPIAIAGLCFSTFALADNTQINKQGQVWQLEEITDGSVPDEIVTDTRAIVTDGLPDGRVATGTNNITEAWYAEPTERYDHGVLGDAVEAAALKITDNNGATYTFRLPSTEVFEDIAPRLADLDRDGQDEVVTILSSRTRGASVAVFKLTGNAFNKVAQSDFIGRSNRWLNIAEIDHFSGNRRPDIAIVETPHLAGTLKFLTLRGNHLTLVAGAKGFSNHFIGSNELRLSTKTDFNGNKIPDLIVPSLARDMLFVIGKKDGSLAELARIQLPAKINRAIGLRQNEGRSEILLGLDDGKIYAAYLKQ